MWKYVKEDGREYWVIGEENVGCGILYNEDGFYINVVDGYYINILGPYDTLEDAMAVGEEKYREIRNENDNNFNA